MAKLLHISASPRGTASESLAIAATFVDTFSDVRPDVAVEHWDLWDGTLPPFGAAAAGAKMSIFAGQEPSGEQAAAWAAVHRTFERFAAADYYLFSVTMWNHGVPYILKQFIDVVSQPGLVFGFDGHTGYTGLVTGKKAVVVYTSAVYGDDRGPQFASTSRRPTSTTGCAGPGSPTSRRSRSGRTSRSTIPNRVGRRHMPLPATPPRLSRRPGSPQSAQLEQTGKPSPPAHRWDD